jgi:hypothetical protein
MAANQDLTPASSSYATRSDGATYGHKAWLHQAIKAREAALHLLQDRFRNDLEAAAQLVGGSRPAAIESQAEYATKLKADYLAESEKLFDLMSQLARHGCLGSLLPPGFRQDEDLGAPVKHG